MNEVIRIVLAVLLVYRLSHLAALERGPFDLALRARVAVLRRFRSTQQHGGAMYRHWIAEGIECPLCVSFWLAVLVPLVLAPAGAINFVLYWFGAAGAVLVLHRSAY